MLLSLTPLVFHTMPRERVLIAVKTYLTLSRKYGETVCIAGVRADGSSIRIYPVPFRRLEGAEQYRKVDWIEADFAKSRTDSRPETHHPKDCARFQILWTPKIQAICGLHAQGSGQFDDRRKYQRQRLGNSRSAEAKPRRDNSCTG